MREGFVRLGDSIFETLLAISMDEQQRGLMYIDPPVPVMSFLYASPQVNKFWMKGTKAPLDIVFCCNGKVSELCYGEPFSLRVIGSNRESNLIIELPYGTVEKNNIKIGGKAEIIKPGETELEKILASRL
jgi:uncharacterized membrane protein (UPF0127 family)